MRTTGHILEILSDVLNENLLDKEFHFEPETKVASNEQCVGFMNEREKDLWEMLEFCRIRYVSSVKNGQPKLTPWQLEALENIYNATDRLLRISIEGRLKKDKPLEIRKDFQIVAIARKKTFDDSDFDALRLAGLARLVNFE